MRVSMLLETPLMRVCSCLAAVAAVAGSGCGPAPAARVQCPDAPAPPAAKTTATAAPPAAHEPDKQLEITLKPLPDRGFVQVEILARGDAAALAAWSMTGPDDGAVHIAGARDDAGPIEWKLDASPEGPLAMILRRPPAGAVHLSYTVDSRPRPITVRQGVAVDPDQIEASGEALLMLPDAFDNRPIAASIHIDAAAVGNQGEGAQLRIGAASSFGIGASQELTARGNELRRASFVAGPIGHAVFDTPEGHDEAAWFGYTSFDPRPIAADVAAFRTAAREFFRVPSSTASQMLLIVSDPRRTGLFVAARRTRSVLVHVAVSDVWSAPLRIAVSAEVLHAWIGERLWIGPEDPAHEAQAYWFTEGLNRHLARDLLFRFGLITPAELLDEMHGLAGALATSPRRTEGNDTLAAHVKEKGRLPILVARGAFYAARVHALIRHKSHGKRSLDDVLRALLDKARERRAALPTSAWVEAVTAELGQQGAEEFTKMIEQGGPIELPEGALGPCFRTRRRIYEAFDLGFDEQATRRANPRVIADLKPDGPAGRAGLRSTDVLADAQIAHGRTDIPVKLDVMRAGERKTIQYRPVGLTASAQGWVRNKDVPDEACTTIPSGR